MFVAGVSGAVFEAPAFVAGFDDVAMVGEAIEQLRRHFGVAKNARPFTGGEIGGDDHRHVFRPSVIRTAQCLPSLILRQISELIAPQQRR